MVTQESPVPGHVKDFILEKSEEDTSVTDNFTGVRCRVIRNEFSENWIKMAEQKAPPWEILKAGVGKIKAAYVEGDIKGGSLARGQACGLINNIPTCRELIEEIIRQAEEQLWEVQARVAG